MKVRSALRLLCKDCYRVRRGNTHFVYCKTFGKHKQRQGFHTSADEAHESGFCFCHLVSGQQQPEAEVAMENKVMSASGGGSILFNPILGLSSLVIVPPTPLHVKLGPNSWNNH
jgi:ribosomal protein L36